MDLSTRAALLSFVGEGVGKPFRNDLVMPWLVGEGDEYRVLPKGEELFDLHEILTQAPLAYVGFLRSGFSDALRADAFRPERVALALRAGWRAVAVVARVKELKQAKMLAPFVAPTAPGPHRTAPLGFTLFSSPWLSQALPLGELGVSRSCIEWSRRLTGLVDDKSPVFCDPELELELELEEDDEMSSQDAYRPPAPLGKMVGALSALSSSRWETGPR